MTNSPIYDELLRAKRRAEVDWKRTRGFTVHLIDCATRGGSRCTCDEIRGILEQRSTSPQE